MLRIVAAADRESISIFETCRSQRLQLQLLDQRIAPRPVTVAYFRRVFGKRDRHATGPRPDRALEEPA